MAVVKQKRQYKIGPVGVVRTFDGDQSLANTIINATDNVADQFYRIAATEAKERGSKQAAEVNLESVTTLDDNTLAPQALEMAAGMGRIQKEAFEAAILQRFEGAIAEDIAAKKNEILQKVSTQRNAPQLFEKLFGEYLNGTGANASGYYKQIIVDQGFQQMRDGQSRLKVAQIARIQAEAKAAREKQKQEELKNARQQGLTGQPSSFVGMSTQSSSQGKIAEGVGVTDTATETEHQRALRLNYVAGSLDRLLNDRNIAPYAEVIQQYFASGGKEYILAGMPLAVRNAVAEIKSVASADSPLEYQEIASANDAQFSNAQQSGNIIKERNARLATMMEGMEANRLQLLEQEADTVDLNINDKINNNDYAIIGQFGSIDDIKSTLKKLEDTDEKYRIPALGEKQGKIASSAESARDQLAEGLIRQIVPTLTSDGMAVFQELLAAGDTGRLRDYIPSTLLYNQFVQVYDSQNKTKLSEIVGKYKAGEKLFADKNTAQQSIQLQRLENAFELALQNNDIDTAQDIFNKATEGNYPLVKDKLPKLQGRLQEKLSQANDKQAQQDFEASIRDIERQTTSTNLSQNLSELTRSQQEVNGDKVKAETVAQSMVDSTAEELILKNIGQLEQNDTAISQLRLGAAYALDINEDIEGLDKGLKEAINKILSQGHNALGTMFTPDNVKLSDLLTKRAGKLSEALAAADAGREASRFQRNLFSGNALDNIDIPDQQKRASDLIADANNIDGVPSNIFELSDAQLNTGTAGYLQDAFRAKIIMPQFVQSTDKLLAGVMSADALDNFMMNTREFVLTDENGELNFQDYAALGLGVTKALKLEYLYNAYVIAPADNKAGFVQQVALELREPMSTATFQANIGEETTPEELIAKSILPPSLHEEFVPIVKAMSRRMKTETLDEINSYARNKFVPYANGYSPHTNGSAIEVNISSYGIKKDIFENGISAKVQEINEARKEFGLNPLYFDKDSNLSIEDIRKEQGFQPSPTLVEGFMDFTSMLGGKSINTIIAEQAYGRGAMAGERIEFETKSRVSLRVLVGPALDYSYKFPMMQLYQVDGMGNVAPVEGGRFHLLADPTMRKEIFSPKSFNQIDLEIGGNFGLTDVTQPMGFRTNQQNISPSGRIPSTLSQELNINAQEFEDQNVDVSQAARGYD